MIPRVNMAAAETDPSVTPYSFGQLLSDIRPGFAFARYGDGEWHRILGWPRVEGRSEVFTPDLCAALQATLLEYNGVKLGMQSVEYLRKREMFSPGCQWLEKNGLVHLKWYEADVMHRASAAGKFQRFADAMRGHDVVLVGPEYLGALPFVSRHIVTPKVFAWGHREEVFAQTDKLRDCIVLVSAGPLGKVLVHRLHGQDRGCCVIDTGAVLDPYCGVRSRYYMRARRQKFKPLR